LLRKADAKNMNKNNSEPYKSWVKNGLYSLLYKQLPSTNLMAASLMEHGKIAGPTAIITDDQPLGRGQLRTKWHSVANKNLTFTLVLPKLNMQVGQQFMLNKAVGLALLQTVSTLIGDVKIKWPNDIYYKNKKLAGILVENQISGKQIKSCLIGIGLNVNQSVWTKEVSNPASLKGITQKSYNLEEVQVLWPTLFYEHLLRFLEKSAEEIDALFNDELYGKGEWHNFRDSEKTFNAHILYVNPNGLLVLENENGEQVEYANKEVRLLI